MKKSIQHYVCLLGIIAMALSATYAYAEGPGGGQGFNRDEMREKRQARMDEMFGELGLSPEQKEKLKAHRMQNQGQGKVAVEKIKAKKDEMRKELQSPNLNEQRVRQLQNEIRSLKAQQDDARLKRILEVREILTPTQFSKFQEFKEKNRGNRRGKLGGQKGPKWGSRRKRSSRRRLVEN